MYQIDKKEKMNIECQKLQKNIKLQMKRMNSNSTKMYLYLNNAQNLLQ